MKKVFIDVDVETSRVRGYGSMPISNNCFEIELDEAHDFFQFFAKYVYEEGQIVKKEDLDKARKLKDEELNRACQESILKGFSHTINGLVYEFSFDTESQLNFQGAERILSSGMIPEISWTVKRNGEYERIMINAQVMSQLVFVILRHKDSNIGKYREKLMPKVRSATTVEEINAIHWDMPLA